MIWNKLARWAGVTAFSTIIPAAAMATVHHSRLTHPTTAPTSLSTRHTRVIGKQLKTVKHTSVVLKSKTASAKNLKSRTLKGKQLRAVKVKPALLKSKKTTGSKLVSRKSTLSKLTAKKHVTSKLITAKSKSHMLNSKKITAKRAVKVATPVTPTM